MPSQPTQPQRSIRSATTRCADGFTMIETIVVLVIIAIVIGFAIPALTTSQAMPDRSLGMATGRSLDKAVREFMLDRAGRAPVASRALEWTAAGGPLDIEGRPYLTASQREALTAGRVQVCRAPAGASNDPVPYTSACFTSRATRSLIVYHGNGRGYRIDVFARKRLKEAWTTGHFACRFAGGNVTGVTDTC